MVISEIKSNGGGELKLLYDFSEAPSITIFTPRSSKAFAKLPPVVWAIDRTFHSLLFPTRLP
ncbi:DUF6886 family protein [Bacillus sp. FSL K6-3431]|uniref:DUF6886 family protein n=1 Tax=Bacillus sp. FSL K6-3431 TaxID=2921500 RepID=UPI004046F5BC